MSVINAAHINSSKCVSPISTIKGGVGRGALLFPLTFSGAAKPAQNMHLEVAARVDVRAAGDCFLLYGVMQEHASLSASNKQPVICRNIK